MALEGLVVEGQRDESHERCVGRNALQMLPPEETHDKYRGDKA